MSPRQLGQDTVPASTGTDLGASVLGEAAGLGTVLYGLMLRLTLSPYLYITLVSQTRSCNPRFSLSTPNIMELISIRTEFM